MSIKEDLEKEVNNIVESKWSIRDGQVVPITEDIKLGNDGVKMKATILYADLVNSTELAIKQSKEFSSEVYKCFLTCSSKLIKNSGGEIRSFDGDRVMGVFIGDSKNTTAAKCALKINYAFTFIIIPKLHLQYPNKKNIIDSLKHCVGIDTSEILVIRGGVRNNNDLVWVGKSPNLAAKLCGIRENYYSTYITKNVYDMLHENAKRAVNKNSNREEEIWESRTWQDKNEVRSVYRTNWWWEP